MLHFLQITHLAWSLWIFCQKLRLNISIFTIAKNVENSHQKNEENVTIQKIICEQIKYYQDQVSVKNNLSSAQG